MSTSELLEKILDPVNDCLTPDAAEKIVALRADDDTQLRIDELAGKANAGTLSDAERAEYDKFRTVFHVITILQSRARRLLKERPTT